MRTPRRQQPQVIGRCVGGPLRGLGFGQRRVSSRVSVAVAMGQWGGPPCQRVLSGCLRGPHRSRHLLLASVCGPLSPCPSLMGPGVWDGAWATQLGSGCLRVAGGLSWSSLLGGGDDSRKRAAEGQRGQLLGEERGPLREEGGQVGKGGGWGGGGGGRKGKAPALPPQVLLRQGTQLLKAKATVHRLNLSLRLPREFQKPELLATIFSHINSRFLASLNGSAGQGTSHRPVGPSPPPTHPRCPNSCPPVLWAGRPLSTSLEALGIRGCRVPSAPSE